MEHQDYFDYLDDLRASGETNMYAAPAYLERTFGMGHEEAVKVWTRWFNTRRAASETGD